MSAAWSCGACATLPEAIDADDDENAFFSDDEQGGDDDDVKEGGEMVLSSRSRHSHRNTTEGGEERNDSVFEGLFECGCGADDDLMVMDGLLDEENEFSGDDEGMVVDEQRIATKKSRKSKMKRRSKSVLGKGKRNVLLEGAPIVPDADEFGFYPMPTRKKGQVYLFESLAHRQQRWKEMIATHAIDLEESGGAAYSIWFRAHHQAPKVEHLLERHQGKPTLNLHGEDIRRTIEALAHKEKRVLKAEWQSRGALAYGFARSDPMLIVNNNQFNKLRNLEQKLIDAVPASTHGGEGHRHTSVGTIATPGSYMPTYDFGPAETPVSFIAMEQNKKMVGFSKHFTKNAAEQKKKHFPRDRPSSHGDKHVKAITPRRDTAFSLDDNYAASEGGDDGLPLTPGGGVAAIQKMMAKRRRAWRNKRLSPFVKQAIDIAENQTIPRKIAVAYATCLGRIFLDPDLGESSYAFAMILRRVAKLQLSMGFHQAGVENLQLCLWIYEDNLGVDAVEVARVLNDCAAAAVAQFEMHLKERNEAIMEKGESISIEQRRADEREANQLYELAEDMYSRAAAILISKGATILDSQVQSIILNLTNIKKRLKNTSHYISLRALLDAALRDTLRDSRSFVHDEFSAVSRMQQDTQTTITVSYLEQAKSMHADPHPQHGSLWMPIADIKKQEYKLRKERNDLLLSMAESRGTGLNEKEKALLLSEDELRGIVSDERIQEIEHVQPSLATMLCPLRNRRLKRADLPHETDTEY